ncbi:PQQ-binding-like beta-propeller repeat protein [Allomuricauda sp. ARW1Y1]|jgi:quinoprotein glucose dehydrogenase|uniref:outer membrane protein assembly factor BamB family protein n=1 Tax=Allomuricauda sp. ARW1Y1 TaxID=2663843 RepID=UPI0015CC2363|nr:PQQ-binding-like beta-propeller repeat protein [Muricauda sp. ARW1Y1]NYJ28214.1 quinoprotein glucose dehydrogenase [Muricauda sp. ARW1Y1]
MINENTLLHLRKIGFGLVTVLLLVNCKQEESLSTNTWTTYKADEKSTSYSPLDQINISNVNQLTNVWTFNADDLDDGEEPAVSSQANPIIIDGVMYANSRNQTVYAINAATGEKLWDFKALGEGEPTAASRGVTYWEDEDGDDKRILYSAGNYLLAINAETGEAITSFGENGKVNLNLGVRDDPEKISVTLTTPGSIYDNLIIIGSRLPDYYGAPPGYVRAYNAKTGERVWTFHTIPHPGEPGYETWPPDAYKYAGGVNCWAGMAIDAERGMVYLALGSPSYDFYGADRVGANLYGNCVLALDAATGGYKWHFQTVHHDIWDYDLPCPPNLVTFEHEGKVVDAVAQATKQGFIFVLDRDTGEPIFPVEEREVPESNLPGEVAYETQPFPLKPAPFVRQSMTEDDLNHYSEADHDSILKKFRSVRYEGLFTPPDLKGTLSMPATRGGANWGGLAYDPDTDYLYIRGNNLPEIQTIVDADKHFAAQNNTRYELGRVTYEKHCVACHGADKKGVGPTIPTLVGLKDKVAEEETLEKIRKGGGMMPGYMGVLTEREERGVLAYLYDLQDTSIEESQEEIADGEKPVRYMNITPYRTWSDPSGNPALKTPWNTLNALNLSTGEYEWQIPVGNDENLQEEDGPETGLLARSGPMVTAGGLVFISGAEDKKIWAFDKKTGEMVWEQELPAANNANVCSYSIDGKQYVALSIGGTEENPSGSIMAFALP